jgi:hypothetical protein
MTLRRTNINLRRKEPRWKVNRPGFTGGSTGVRLAERSEKSGKRATSSVLIGLRKLFEMEEKPWPEGSLSEFDVS